MSINRIDVYAVPSKGSTSTLVGSIWPNTEGWDTEAFPYSTMEQATILHNVLPHGWFDDKSRLLFIVGSLS
jgi:xylose isomerase